jgi:hypothetical protein
MASISAMAPIGGLGSLKTISGGVPATAQYTPRKGVDRFQIQPSHKESNSKLHSTNVAHSIHTIENCEQRRKDLSIFLIRFGHVLRRTKALKKMLFQNIFSVG